MSDVLEKLPEIIVFAGPNGSGKTTITRMAKIIEPYIATTSTPQYKRNVYGKTSFREVRDLPLKLFFRQSATCVFCNGQRKKDFLSGAFTS